MKIIINELIKHNALVWPNQRDVVVSKSKPNIFLGGGISTKTKVSQAVPFDLLGFMLTAEQVRRMTDSQVHMLIADQHAWLANNLVQSEALLAGNTLASMAQSIIYTCKLPNWHIHLASNLFPEALPMSYEESETRDINHFAHNLDCGIKIGWTFSPKVAGIIDESHFDELHSLSTILIKPGITTDPKKPHESPYICTDSSCRVIIGPNHNLQMIGAIQNHLRNICQLFEHILGPLPNKTPLEVKIQQIINTIVE